MKKQKKNSFINTPYAVDEKTKERNNRLGKYFNSIDFEIYNSIPERDLTNYKSNPAIGKFTIGGQTFELTYSECNRLMETISDAQHTYKQKKRLGLYQ